MAKVKTEIVARSEPRPEGLTDAQIDLVRRTICQGATDDELALFLHDCQRRGVHPLDKLLHFTKRQGRYTPVTSIDLFRSQAEATGCHAGTDDTVFTGAGQYPDTATVTVYRVVGGTRCPFTAAARWLEYYPGDGAPGFMWRKMPRTMLGKCAEALALRKAFPKQLGGLYTGDELREDEGHQFTAAVAKSMPEVVEAAPPKPVAVAAPTMASPEGRILFARFVGEIAKAKSPAFLLHVAEEINRNKARLAVDQLAALKDAYKVRLQALHDEDEERKAMQGEPALAGMAEEGPYGAGA